MKKIVFIVLALVLTAFNTRFYWQTGVPYTHDGENHLARFANYKIALKEGQFPPRWAPNLQNHYGYPVFNYNYPLANILSVPFSVLKIEYETTFKIIMTLSVLSGLWGVWYWLSWLPVKTSAQRWGMLAYGLNPYLLSSILFRGNIGEVMALGLLPWLFGLVHRLQDHSRSWSKVESVGWIGVITAFLLAHNVAVVFSVPLLVGYAVVVGGRQSWLPWWRAGLMAVVSGGLALWFWLPALAEKHLVVLDQAGLSQLYAQHFVTWEQLLFSPLQFGFSYLGSVDSLAMTVGVSQLLSLVMVTMWWFKHKYWWQMPTGETERKLPGWLGYAVGAGWLLLICQLAVTQPLWQHLPIVRFIQFPWRLTLFWSVLMVPVVAWGWDHIQGSLKWLLVLVMIVQSQWLWRAQPLEVFHHPTEYYDVFSQSTTTANENMPKSFTYAEIGDWQPTVRIFPQSGRVEPTVTGSGLLNDAASDSARAIGQVTVQEWRGSRRRYQLQLSQPATVVEPTIKFAGWQTVVEKKGEAPYTISYFDDDQVAGRLAYQLSPGEYLVTTRFTQATWPRWLGNGVSFLTAVTIMVWLVSPTRIIFNWRQITRRKATI